MSEQTKLLDRILELKKKNAILRRQLDKMLAACKELVGQLNECIVMNEQDTQISPLLNDLVKSISAQYRIIRTALLAAIAEVEGNE